jgi:uncharacterized protein YicC (UPF0701 family)
MCELSELAVDLRALEWRALDMRIRIYNNDANARASALVDQVSRWLSHARVSCSLRVSNRASAPRTRKLSRSHSLKRVCTRQATVRRALPRRSAAARGR